VRSWQGVALAGADPSSFPFLAIRAKVPGAHHRNSRAYFLRWHVRAVGRARGCRLRCGCQTHQPRGCAKLASNEGYVPRGGITLGERTRAVHARADHKPQGLLSASLAVGSLRRAGRGSRRTLAAMPSFCRHPFPTLAVAMRMPGLAAQSI
jgi:hypothetical protein